jgi:hypothetical protein
MKAWSHLPNAAHIDWIIADVKAHPDRWDAAHGAEGNVAYASAWSAARGAEWNAAYASAWDAAWDAARGAAQDVVRGAARGAVWDAIAALVAWDDCAYILDLAPGAVRLMASTGHPAAILLYPAVLAKESTL